MKKNIWFSLILKNKIEQKNVLKLFFEKIPMKEGILKKIRLFFIGLNVWNRVSNQNIFIIWKIFLLNTDTEFLLFFLIKKRTVLWALSKNPNTILSFY